MTNGSHPKQEKPQPKTPPVSEKSTSKPAEKTGK